MINISRKHNCKIHENQLSLAEEEHYMLVGTNDSYKNCVDWMKSKG